MTTVEVLLLYKYFYLPIYIIQYSWLYNKKLVGVHRGNKLGDLHTYLTKLLYIL